MARDFSAPYGLQYPLSIWYPPNNAVTDYEAEHYSQKGHDAAQNEGVQIALCQSTLHKDNQRHMDYIHTIRI